MAADQAHAFREPKYGPIRRNWTECLVFEQVIGVLVMELLNNQFALLSGDLREELQDLQSNSRGDGITKKFSN